MAKTWKLSKEAVAAIGDITSIYDEVNAEIERLREQFDGMSETWQEGEKGEAVNDWLSTLQEAIDELEQIEIPEQPE